MPQAYFLSMQQYLRGQDPFMYSQKYSPKNAREPKTFLTLHLPCVCHQLWCHCGFPMHCQTAATWNKLGVTVIQTPQAGVKTFQGRRGGENHLFYSMWQKLQSGRRERTGRSRGMEIKKSHCNLIKTKKGMRRQTVEDIGKIGEKWGENRGEKIFLALSRSIFLYRIQ